MKRYIDKGKDAESPSPSPSSPSKRPVKAPRITYSGSVRVHSQNDNKPSHTHTQATALPQKALLHSDRSGASSAPLSSTAASTSTNSIDTDMSGPKRLVIKNFRVKPRIPQDYEDSTWNKLKSAVVAIQSQKPVSHSLEELYKDVENMCYQGMASRLYVRLQDTCAAHAMSLKGRVINQTGDIDVYLKIVESVWKQHCSHMVLIRSVFLYLDRTYVLQANGLRSIWDMGLHLFREHVVSAQEVLAKIVGGVLEMVKRERDGESINVSLLQTITHMLSDLRLYNDTFESQFLKSTHNYYGSAGTEFVNSMDVPDYLKYVQDILKSEQERATRYLDSSTKRSVLAAVEKQLLEKHQVAITQKGFDRLCEEGRHGDLCRMFALFGRIRGHKLLRDAFSKYVKGKGKTIVNDKEKDATMVVDLLAFKQATDQIVEQSFASSEAFVNSLKESFESFINSRQNKPAELIAKHVDVLLKSGNKVASEDVLESDMDRVMALFRFIQGKDVFEAFYKKDLAKRLLLARSASFDAERTMLSKLKSECGAGFTSRLEGMFHDMRLSADVKKRYNESKAQLQAQLPSVRSGIDLNVHVLTQGNWPAYQATEMTIPSHMLQLLEGFKAFYLSKYSGRKLTWIHSLGHCTLRARFPSGKKELQVSLYQTLVLLLFNVNVNVGVGVSGEKGKGKESEKGPVLSYSDIHESLQLEEGELKRTLQSLACGRVRVLKKSPKGRDVNNGDTFQFNSSFKAQLIRIKVNQIQIKETVEEKEATEERVFQDRQYQVDAAIVRIMKARKHLSHQLLLVEIFNQLKFQLSPQDVKKRIESLIERDYLERDSKDTQLYHYLA